MTQLLRQYTLFARLVHNGRSCRAVSRHRCVAHHGRSLSSAPPKGEWRKQQLQRLERKFDTPTDEIESDVELQPMWKEMESRVTKRRSRTLAEAGSKNGRRNIRSTDEDVWLHAGLYDTNKKPPKDDK